jgi:hypothetical protein
MHFSYPVVRFSTFLFEFTRNQLQIKNPFNALYKKVPEEDTMIDAKGPPKRCVFRKAFKGDLKCFQISQFLTYSVAIGYK